MNHQSIENKVAIIAGGAKNLGGLIAQDLVKKGVTSIVIHYHSDKTKADAEQTVANIKALGANAIAFQADLTKPEKNAELFDLAIKEFGGVDIAINTTGMVIKKAIVDVSEKEYDMMFDINAKAAFFFIQEAGKKLNDNGRICTLVSSLLAAYTDSYAIYPGAKAPIEHFTRAASKEFGARGISVTAVGPGPMDTPFFYGQESPEAQAYHKSAAALSAHSSTGLTDIEDISPLVVFLVSEGWWITGQTIFANGGYTTR